MDRVTMMQLSKAFCALVLGAAIAGCGDKAATSAAPKASFHSIDITGAEYARKLELPDADGKLRSLADFKGKVVVVFFGYTQCPDVCPTNLTAMAQVMKLLGDDAQRVQVLFATVDPGRDTQELLAQYVPSFDPSFLGLRGDAEATIAVTIGAEDPHRPQACTTPPPRDTRSLRPAKRGSAAIDGITITRVAS